MKRIAKLAPASRLLRATGMLTNAAGMLAALALIDGVILAQDPFAAPTPKAGAPAAGAGGEAKGEADPFGAGKPGAKAKPTAAADLTKPEPRAIQILRDSNPTTPLALMQAAQTVLQYGRADECKRYLARLLADNPADDALAGLASKFTDFLFRIAREKEVQPEGAQAADLILTAVQRTVQNAERITAAIGQLSASELSERLAALEKLRAAGTHAVPPMLRVLADTDRAKEHRYIRAALVHLAAASELPLIGVLDGSDDAVKAQVIAVLGRMGSSRAVMHLVRPALDQSAPAEIRAVAAAAMQKITGRAPDSYDAKRYLAQEAARLLGGDLPYNTDPDNRVEIWSWDESKREVVPRKLPKRDAAVFLAARVAADLYALEPGDNAAQRLMLLTSLALAKVLAGLDQPLPIEGGTAGATALTAGPQVVSQVLADAMKFGRVPAAIAAAEVLGQLGDASALRTPGSAASPLADALVFPDRRVRLAAALAAVKLAPGANFPGASRVAETLCWFAGTTGDDLILIGHPRGEDAQTLVGYVNALGYDGRGAYIGRTLAAQAFASPDCEFILMADAIDMPPVKELVQWLRRDFRTARLPIGVMARGEQLDMLRDAFADDPFTTVFPRLHSTDVTAGEIEKLKEIAGRNLVGRDERIAQAQASLAALAKLAKDAANLSHDELLRQEPVVMRALNNPALTADAAGVLALFGTPKAQTLLVDFASQNAHPLADREAVAAAFAAAVKARGLLLTQPQIAMQYARYNASETQGKPTQAILGSIIDAIEAPAIARGDLSKKE